MTQGFLNLVLHAHLPFVRHPDDVDPLEEDWLYEAITETYLPLLKLLDKLRRDDICDAFTLVLTPTLLNMLDDSLLQTRYVRRLEQLIELAKKEIVRTKNQPEFHHVAKMYLTLFQDAYDLFCDQYGKNIIQGFRQFQESGQIEIISCAATHGYLPLMLEKEAIRAQILQGVKTYERFFHKKPQGFWLPECGYKEGIDKILAEAGIKYSFLDTHCLLYATPRPKYGTNAPIYSSQGIAFFARDVETSQQVWSAKEGYPGDFDYREFYRDIGYDLDYSYIKPYLHSTGIRKMTGIKYYRITGMTDHKEVYHPEWAKSKAAIHADNFIFNRQKQVEYLRNFMKQPPLLTAPYDAELYGHWWYEGPQFLEFVIKKLHYDQTAIKLITPSSYLKKFPSQQSATPTEGSWGHEGYHEVWLNGTNHWIYPYLHQASQELTRVINRYRHPTSLEERTLNQAARELLLAQSSDWAFIMKAGTMVDYAIRRTKTHLNQFSALIEMLQADQIDESKLNQIETTDNIFPELDYKIYQTI